MKRKVSISGLILFIFFSLLMSGFNVFAQDQFDILILNGTVIDGTGKKGFKADIAIKADKIVEIGDLQKYTAKEVLDAGGLVVAPGFIDVHTHCDRGLLRNLANENYIKQGVTTVIGGNCGGSPLDLEIYFKQVLEKNPSTNIGILIGHNTIRRLVMGPENREPSKDEMNKMKAHVEKAMKDGAVGLSSGLGYLPGMFSKIEEVIELNKIVGNYNGVYATHLRDQGNGMYNSVEEAIRIGEEGNTAVQVSHLKLSLDKIWGETDKLDKTFRDAIDRGVEVYSDQYPYIAGSTGLGAVFPRWSLEGGKLEERLKNPESRELIKKEFFSSGRMKSYIGRDMLASIQIASYSKNPEFEGKTLKQILEMRGVEPNQDNGVELAIEIVENGGASCVFFLMDEKDVPVIMNFPYNMIGSDGSVISYGRGVPHPRSYGTFPRVLGKYVREDKIMKAEKAIYKMTALPAKAFRIKNRGILKTGNYADITIYNPETIIDKATFAEPHQYSVGVKYVIVNGVMTVKNFELSDKFGGKPVYGEGFVK